MKYLDICEIFYSLQGESSYMGRPCVFIRLAGCNLNCSYCDTVYSHAKGTKMSFEQILKSVSRYPVKLVELTGGEPLIQEESTALMQTLLESGYTVLLETNGTIYLDEVPLDVIKIVDIKCPGSGEGLSFQFANLKLLAAHDEIKFVISNYPDYCFAREIIEKYQLAGRILHFSPVTELLPAELLAEWLLADGLPVKLGLQLHKLLNLR
ncbi:MAG: radical SAM protein [Candidatus Cloacimonetes bacterium]|nr:radical SAM protein [Candidatus Cloacimonadota bacterium]MDD2506714.1 radical SAM protein [Candidatus Cloacimonadota bacterium]MDD4560305.1 radical SAM protein [Candidatus Cloacimonadota bacterium]